MRKEKVREQDFKEEERPSTRLEQFFDIAKHRFVELLKLSLLQTVFNMPLIATIVTFYLFSRNASSLNSLMTVFLITAAGLLISMMSSFTGLTGLFHCLKKIAFAEGEYASSDYFHGLTSNGKKGIVIGLIVGISTALTVIGSFFFYFYLSSINPTIAGFGIAILVTQSLVVLILAYYSISQIVIYENEMKNILKNSLIFTLMRFQYNLPLFILHPGIIVALMVIMELTMYIALGLMILFASFGGLIWTLNTISAFDKFIHKENYPEHYRKGLNKEV